MRLGSFRFSVQVPLGLFCVVFFTIGGISAGEANDIRFDGSDFDLSFDEELIPEGRLHLNEDHDLFEPVSFSENCVLSSDNSTDVEVGDISEQLAPVHGGLLTYGVIEEPATKKIDNTESTPTSPMTVDLFLSETPKLNQVVELKCVVSTIIDAPNTTAQITLPDGFDFVQGNLSWKGNIAAGDQKAFNATIKSVKLGNFTIECHAESVLSGDSWFGGRDYIFISVSSDFGLLSDKPLVDRSRIRSDNGTLVSISSEFTSESTNKVELIAPQPTELESGINDDNISVKSLGTVVVRGRWSYRDRAGNDQPLKWASVWIYDRDTLTGDDYLGSALTNSDGTFETGPIDNNDGEGGGQDIYVRVVASSSACEVKDVDNELYDAYTTTIWDNVADGTLDTGSWRTPIEDGERPAWWIYGDGINGWNYLRNEVLPEYEMPNQIFRWEYGHDSHYNLFGCPDITHYHHGGEIHITGTPTTGHANDPDVLLHEYGHAVMWSAYGNTMPESNCPEGGHWYWQDIGTVNCAWVEGWASFFSLAIFDDRYFTDTTQNFNMDFETPDSAYDALTGDHVEGRVVAALYDIFDSANDGYDSFPNGFDDTWDTVYNVDESTLAEFYSAWKSRSHDIPKCNAAIFQNTIDYNAPPACTITSPNGGGWYSGTIQVSSSASDTDGSVSSVEFRYSKDNSNWNLIGIDSSSFGGWSVSWDTTAIEYDSSVWVSARAKDNLGEYSSWDNSDSYFGIENGARGWVNLASYNYPSRYIRHSGFLGEVTEIATSIDKKDSTFRMVPGLADSSLVSFESVNFPGYYLRHQGFRLMLSKKTDDQLFKEDATFRMVSGLADPAGRSFESYNFPEFYIRHSGFHLYVQSGSGELFNADATFIVEPCLASFASYNYPTRYIRHCCFLGEVTEIESMFDDLDSTFEIVPGLADSSDSSYVSFESVNFPGYYLRHQGFRLMLSQATNDQLFKEDATFRMVPGLADSAGSSFESYNFPGLYIRHSGFHLYVQGGSGDLFNADATFWLEPPKAPILSTQYESADDQSSVTGEPKPPARAKEAA